MFDYRCQVCRNIRTTAFKEPVECCGSLMARYIRSAPGSVVPPQHQAAKDKLGYYGITNIVTGEGITKNTRLNEPAGINVRNLDE